MADEQQVKMLKRSVSEWNRWRDENPNVSINLSGAYLRGADLSEANLSKTDLREADLRGADLRDANLIEAELTRVDLREANLIRADLRSAYLSLANLSLGDLSVSDLREANLSVANLSVADLRRASLREADLSRATVSEAYLTQADLEYIICDRTIFADVDLSTVVGLENVVHRGPSSIDFATLYRSQGKLPSIFLRGCGMPENLITYLPSLVGKAIDFYSCFISYSHEDRSFARRLHDTLQGQGIRCWLDEHQLNPGDPLHPTIYEAIRVYDKVLLCCSETALKSWWVENEFNSAIRKEEDYKQPLLVPLNVDGYLFQPNCKGWIPDKLKQRVVADFTAWKDHDGFEKAVKDVIKALRTDGGKPPHPEPKLKRKE